MKKFGAFVFVLAAMPCLLFGSVKGSKVNLLVNPDAETGNLTGWTDPDVAWGTSAEITPHGGSYFFWPLQLDIAYTHMYQDVDVSAYSSQIDAGNYYFHLSGWLANWDQYPHDQATLAIMALSADSQQLLYGSRSQRSPVWNYYQIESKIPAGSRTLRVDLIATRYIGADNDAYFDDLYLGVDSIAPTITVTVSSQSGLSKVAIDSVLQLLAVTNGGIDSGYIWTSSFNAVATVDTNGLVTGHTAGRAMIQAEGKTTHASGYFEVVVYATNYVIFIHPENGEVWEGDTTQTVTWELIGSITSGILYYTPGSGAGWIEIDTINDLTTLQYSWLTPDTDKILNDCMMKMTWSGGEATSALFSIVPKAGIEEEATNQKDGGQGGKITAMPNPFVQSTVISNQLPGKSKETKIQIYDISGKLVEETDKTIIGKNLRTGVYFVKVGDGKELLKIVKLK